MSQRLIEQNDSIATTKALIASNFFRFANNPNKADNTALLFLVAALVMLNSGNDAQTLNIARRLANAGLTRSNRNK
jgi:hypothetical protein